MHYAKLKKSDDFIYIKLQKMQTNPQGQKTDVFLLEQDLGLRTRRAEGETVRDKRDLLQVTDMFVILIVVKDLTTHLYLFIFQKLVWIHKTTALDRFLLCLQVTEGAETP